MQAGNAFDGPPGVSNDVRPHHPGAMQSSQKLSHLGALNEFSTWAHERRVTALNLHRRVLLPPDKHVRCLPSLFMPSSVVPVPLIRDILRFSCSEQQSLEMRDCDELLKALYQLQF